MTSRLYMKVVLILQYIAMLLIYAQLFSAMLSYAQRQLKLHCAYSLLSFYSCIFTPKKTSIVYVRLLGFDISITVSSKSRLTNVYGINSPC
jgi:hypothetical protein